MAPAACTAASHRGWRSLLAPLTRRGTRDGDLTRGLAALDAAGRELGADQRAVGAARRLLTAAHRSWHLDLGKFQVAAAADCAGVLIEYPTAGALLSVIVHPDGAHAYFVVDDVQTGEVEDGVAPLDRTVRDFWTYALLPWHAVPPRELS